MNSQFKMTYLSGGDEVFGADFGAAKVYTITSKEYSERCPNAARLIANLKFNVDVESELMVGVLDKQNSIEVAKAWIKRNPQWLNTWLAGVTTFEGKEALPTAQKYFGL
ncbi:Glycine betaine-binding protein OpuAC precursor [compost metagenome]